MRALAAAAAAGGAATIGVAVAAPDVMWETALTIARVIADAI